MGREKTQVKHVAVYGYYNNNNIGDEAFKDCFRHLWPDVRFDFINSITDTINEDYDAIFFGGGDLFDQQIKNSSKVKIPIGMIGIGYNHIHSSNKHLFEKAKIIITRNESPHLVAEDLCFSLPEIKKTKTIINKPVTIFLNDFLVPRKNAPEWVDLSHRWFVSEFSDICDNLYLKGHTLNFVPMCTNKFIDDRRSASHILSKMEKRHTTNWILESPESTSELSRVISNSSLVITQRLHGSIFSYLCDVPQISINHHDKMKQFCDKINLNSSINYYGFNKELFFRHFDNSSYNDSRAEYLNNARQRWNDLSHIVAQEFSL